MSHYGQLLDSGYDPSKDTLYASFVQYFNNPLMTKIRDTNGYSMYLAKMNALLGIEYRYIIIFIYQDEAPIGSKEKLDKLRWVSLQTRTLREDHRLPLHTYIPTRLPSLDKKITLFNHDTQQYNYKVENLPITVTLLPSGKSANSGVEYQASGTLVTALETFHTIVSFS